MNVIAGCFLGQKLLIETKAINLVVHDATDDGIFIGPEATGAEVNGFISTTTDAPTI